MDAVNVDLRVCHYCGLPADASAYVPMEEQEELIAPLRQYVVCVGDAKNAVVFAHYDCITIHSPESLEDRY